MKTMAQASYAFGEGLAQIAVRRAASFERRQDLAVVADAFVDFDHAVVERRGQIDAADEEFRAMLIADAQLIAQAARGDEHGAGAFAFEQRVGGDCRAHMDGGDAVCGQVFALRDAQQAPYSFDGRVVVVFRVFGQELGGTYIPSGVSATRSVNVPPRSIQMCHCPSVAVMSFAQIASDERLR